MDLEKVKLALYKYQIKSLILTIDKDTKHEVHESCIVNFSIVEDYDKYFFPYFEMTIAVPTATFRAIKKNAGKIKANLNLYKGKFKQMMSTDSLSGASFKKAVTGTFYAYTDDSSPDLTEGEQKMVEKSKDQYGQLSTLKILLYNQSFYNKYQLVVNDVLENVSLAESLTYVLNKAKVTKVLLSPPTNYKLFKQFILTPIPLSQQIERICNTYAIHKKGTVVFFGLDRLYIIDKVPKCTAYSNNEFKITYIVADSNSSTIQNTGGAYSDKDGKFNVLNASQISFKNEQEKTKKLLGSNVVSINNNGKVTKTNKKATKVTRVLVQDEGNSTAKSLKRTMTESKRVLTAQFKDVDMGMLTPNKQFVVTLTSAQHKKYNGKYRLTRVIHSFSKEGTYYQLTTSAEFKG